ncbi:LysR family transcriptional regulator [Marimonas sp. MJW-29]|uniref:LysR family transcriptional regulator n=1 Tax=Sulfitobacter sediminis TaxID=3234186 RepID=A0ABV3RH54_9RHOB
MDQDQPDWNLLRAFEATAQEGSLSAAARRLGLTQPTLSRQIAALEDRLALMLFERNGRYLHLTDAGRELLPHVQDMGDAANRLSLSASGQQSDLAGLVRITASEVASAHMLPPILQSLRLRAPQIIAEVVAGDDIRNLMTREADIALRHVRPEQPNLIARLIAERKGYFYATTGYLDKRGRPETLADLAEHDWIGMGDLKRVLEYMFSLNLPITEDNFRVRTESGLVAWEMCKTGLGIIPMDETVAAGTPGLEKILPDELVVTFPLWLVAHREVHTNPRIRLVYDLLGEALG